MLSTAQENALHAWLVEATGLDGERVVWARQRAPRPSRSFVEMRLTSGPTMLAPLDEVRHADVVHGETETFDAKVLGHRRATLSINAYAAADEPGVRAGELLERAQLSLSLPETVAAFEAVDLVVVPLGSARDLSALLDDAAWESRAQMDVRIGWAASLSAEDVDYFEHVSAAGSVGGLAPTVEGP